MPRAAVQLPLCSSPLARARRTVLKLLRFWVAPGAARFEHRGTGRFWGQLHPAQEPPPGMGEVLGPAGSSRPSLRSALTAAPLSPLSLAPVPRPPTAPWTPPAQTRCLRLCLGRKRKLWLCLLFPAVAGAGAAPRGLPPPRTGLSRPPSPASEAALPSPARSPRWARRLRPRWWAAAGAATCC